MYRPEWFEGIANGRGVAQIAVDIHSTCCGSMERGLQDQLNDVHAIRWVLDNWKEPESAFDNAVHYLLSGAIAEFEESKDST